MTASDKNQKTTSERVTAHEEAMSSRIDSHTARSEERLRGAVSRTSEAIGKTARFVSDHAPEPIGRRVDDVAARAQAALEDDHR